MTTIQSIGYGYSPCAPCCQTGCPTCPNGMAQCWTMTVNGNPAPYNGTFCLVNTGACVFQDKCTNLWTLKVAGGGTTLTSSNGAVYTLSENFNCNGLNSFALAKSPAGSTWQASLTISPTNCNAYPCYPNCTAPPCYALCPNGIAQCWLLTISGMPLLTQNGSFCLVLQPGPSCLFSDPCGSGYTLAITGGTVTLQWGGSVTWSLSGNSTFQCNGSNTFVLTNSPTTGQYPQSVTITPTNCANRRVRRARRRRHA